MIMVQKKTNSLSKVMKLISVLQKCNGKASIVSSEALISPKAAKILGAFLLLILTGGIGYGAYYIQPSFTRFIPLESLSRSLMMMILIMSFVLSVKDIVTVLYTADDVSLLLPMPFSANQIVMAKLAVAGRFPVILSLIIVNSVCLGLGIRAGEGVPFIIGTVLSSILMPVTGIALATLLVVIPFRLFGFIRNRDMIVVMSGVLTLVMLGAYMFVNQKLRQGSASQAAEAVTAVASIAGSIPNIAFMCRYMFGGNIMDFFISAGLSFGVILLSFLAVRLFYISTALAMQNSSVKRKAVTKENLGTSKKADAVRALTAYESKNTRRNPAYLIYGFAMTFLWPALIILPLVLSDTDLMGAVAFPLDTGTALTAAVLLGVICASFVCSFNILPGTAFSREGSTFSMLKTLPVDFRDYFRSKRKFSLRIYSLGSVLYILIFGIVCVVLGMIKPESSWVILVSALVCYFCDLIYINCLLLKDAGKPYFTWDTETEISRKLCWINIIAILIGVIAVVAFIVSLTLLKALTADSGQASQHMIYGICAAFTALVLLVSLAFNRFAEKRGAAKLMNFE